jgi:hypothetical protein
VGSGRRGPHSAVAPRTSEAATGWSPGYDAAAARRGAGLLAVAQGLARGAELTSIPETLETVPHWGLAAVAESGPLACRMGPATPMPLVRLLDAAPEQALVHDVSKEGTPDAAGPVPDAVDVAAAAVVASAAVAAVATVATDDTAVAVAAGLAAAAADAAAPRGTFVGRLGEGRPVLPRARGV